MQRAVKRAGVISMAAGLAAMAIGVPRSNAATYAWSAGSGIQNWSTGWGGGYPNLPADIATLPGTLSGDLLINMDVADATVGALTLGDANGHATDIGNSGSTLNPLILDNTGGTGNTLINSIGTGANIFSAPIWIRGTTAELASTSTQALTLSGPIQAVGGNGTFNLRLPSSAGVVTVNGDIRAWDPVNADTTSGALLARTVTLNLGTSGIDTTAIINGRFVNGDGTTQQSSGSVTITGGNTSAGRIEMAVLNADNSAFANTVFLNEATLVLANDHALGNGNFANNLLRLQSGSGSRWLTHLQSDNDARNVTIGALQIQGGTLTISGEHALTLNTDIFQSNNREMQNLLPAGKTLTLNGFISIFNAVDSGRKFTFDGPGDTIVNSLIRNDNDYSNRNSTTWAPDTGTNNVIKRGTGTVTLNNAASTWKGTTEVAGGLLIFNGNNTWGQTSAITVDADGAIAFGPGIADPNLAALGAKIDNTSTGAFAISPTESTANVDFTTLGGGNLASMSLGSQAPTMTYSGTITPANSKYRIGGGIGMDPTITLPNANQLTGANSVEYANGGTIVVGAAQNYTGVTILSGANSMTNQLRAEARDAVSTSSIFISTALQTGLIGNGGTASALGASTSDASNLVFNGGTLQYTGAGASTDRLFTVGLSGGTLDASGTGPVNFTNTGAIVDDETGGAGNRTLTFTGTNTGANQLSASIGDLATSQISISKTGAGNWTLAGPQTYTGSTTVADGLLSMQSNLTTSSGITVSGGTLQLAPGGGSNRLIVAPTPTISGSGKIDLADNKMIVTTAGATGTWTGTAYDGVSGMVQSARNGGAWNGPNGITSSTAASNANPKLFSIGVVKVGDLHAGLADTDTTAFAGQTVHGSDTIAMYTYGGDANLDGKINIDDYGLIDSHVGQSGTAFGWHNGDFNYDGKINIDDYGIIDGNIGAQGAPIPTTAGALALSGGVSLDGVSAVPEPASLGLIAIAGAGLLRRKRRRIA